MAYFAWPSPRRGSSAGHIFSNAHETPDQAIRRLDPMIEHGGFPEFVGRDHQTPSDTTFSDSEWIVRFRISRSRHHS